MTDLVKPGQGIVFMKVGTHAQEALEAIIERKTKEIESAGMAFWGYGGNTCHPRTMVQPFARQHERLGKTIYLCMEPMASHHFAERVRAEEYSEDGITWVQVPNDINVLGSRYALLIKNLRSESFALPINRTRVAVGNSMGAAGSKYVMGRVDKACLEVTDETASDEDDNHEIRLVADLVPPYAVFLRNKLI
jgi:hypothetical protein